MNPWLTATHYLPILTTILSALFCGVLVQAVRTRRSGPHLAWWAVGAFCYGAGTLIESAIALNGNTVELTKAWYVAGALLGGFPLAQGAAFLHVDRRTASALGWTMTSLIVVMSVLVVLSPVDLSHFQATRPTGAILGWRWIRFVTPVINLYAFLFLVGGAVASAVQYARKRTEPARVGGNVLIAVGGLLPGIGGGMAAAGMVEALYVLELVGLVLIWGGYGLIVARGQRGHGPLSRGTEGDGGGAEIEVSPARSAG
ncbi:MAG TPA: hypothetical protein VKT78_20830 [Fimbriimonadaceae bacterium]|nr:hypothetical protein [Fimbriimonadaceae bacterium]